MCIWRAARSCLSICSATIDDPGSRRRRRKIVFLVLLLLGLALLLGLVIWYLLFRQPIPLPPIPATQIPAYSTSIYGPSRPVGVAVSPSGDRIYVTQGGTAAVGAV